MSKWSMTQVKAAVVLQADGKGLAGDPQAGQTVTVKRGKGPAEIPIQYILRELRAAYPKTTFTPGT